MSLCKVKEVPHYVVVQVSFFLLHSSLFFDHPPCDNIVQNKGRKCKAVAYMTCEKERRSSELGAF